MSRYKKKGKKRISLTLKLMYILLISLLVVSFSMARYRSTYNATVTGNLAKWTFIVNESDQEGFLINLGDTTDVQETYNSLKKVIYPGLDGIIEIDIDCTNCNVAIDYSIEFSKPDSTNIPAEIEFYTLTDGEKQYILSNSEIVTSTISGTRELAQIESVPIKRVYIYWQWKLNKSIDESQYQGKNFYINTVVTGKQHISE